MNESERQLQDIERGEHWLRGIPTPGPDAVALDRVKYAVRRACIGDAAEPGDALRATGAAKRAVRRELSRDRATHSPATARRHWIIRIAPALSAAAVVAFAVVVLRDVSPSVETRHETALTIFTETLDDEPVGIDAELADLASDMLEMESTWASSGQNNDFGALLDEINATPGDASGEDDSL